MITYFRFFTVNARVIGTLIKNMKTYNMWYSENKHMGTYVIVLVFLQNTYFRIIGTSTVTT